MENKENPEGIKIRRCDLHSVLAVLGLGNKDSIDAAWNSVELMLKNVEEGGIRKKATEEFFKHIVHVYPVAWDCAELKYEGWDHKTPNLIKLLKGDTNGCSR